MANVDSWGQKVEAGDSVLIVSPNNGTFILTVGRMSDNGTWWGTIICLRRTFKPTAGRVLHSQRDFCVKVFLDEIVLSAITMTDGFIKPPAISITVGE
jgi:hypothetical protein